MSDADVYHMKMAIEYAKKGLYSTRPNPCVGCVIVNDGKVVGTGFHPKAGEPHAEIFALRMAQNKAKGATVYVTLEPCSHYGRTPPCSQALIEAGVSRVVIATLDPNPKVLGRGMSMLKQAGIEVVEGICTLQARAINAGFFKAMTSQLPYVRLKMAASLDGCIAMATGESKWITSDESRLDVQYLRLRSGAIITGSGTIMADNPALSVRLENQDMMQPKIIVMDRSGQLRPTDDYQVLNKPDTLIWRDDIARLLSVLAIDYQCHDVLVEAGSKLATAFLLAGAVDELIVYQAPCFLGKTARPMFVGQFEELSDKLSFELLSVEQMGLDIKSRFRPKSRTSLSSYAQFV